MRGTGDVLQLEYRLTRGNYRIIVAVNERHPVEGIWAGRRPAIDLNSLCRWLDADPFLCAQNVPMSIDYRTLRMAGGTATVVAVTTMSPGSKPDRMESTALSSHRAR